MALTPSSWAQCVNSTRSRSHTLSHQEEDDGDGDTSQLRLVDCWRVPSSQRGWVWAPARRITVPPPSCVTWEASLTTLEFGEWTVCFMQVVRVSLVSICPRCVRVCKYHNDTKVWSLEGLGGKTRYPCPTCSSPTGRTGLVSGKLEVCMLWLCGSVNTLGEIMTDWDCKSVSKVSTWVNCAKWDIYMPDNVEI